MQALVVLHAQPYREQDWRLDVFSADAGRLSVVLNKPTLAPDLFTLYQAAWPPTDLPRVKGWQPHTHWYLEHTALYCGLYLNELLTQLLPNHEPLPALFRCYQQVLAGLSHAGSPEPWLRLFEGQLLHALGYGFSWALDHQGRPLQPHQHYAFQAGEGFVLSGAERPLSFLGADLLALQQGSRAPAHWRIARVVLRAALDDILPKPLYSRDLILGPHILLEEKP